MDPLTDSTPADEKQSGGERWRDIRRNNLLDAASRIFARQGYEASSVEDIAFEAGIGKPTLYRYFNSKEALFEAVFRQELDELERRLDAALVPPGDFEERLARLIWEMVPTFRTHFSSMRNLDDGESSKRRLYRQRRSMVEARVTIVIEEAQARGQARALDAAMAAKLIIGMVRAGVSADYLSDIEVARAVVDMALHGAEQGRLARPGSVEILAPRPRAVGRQPARPGPDGGADAKDEPA